MLRRWCTAEKRNALNKWKRQFADATFYIGIAADEDRPIVDENEYPLIDYGITESSALQMCIDNGYDFRGLYAYFRRASCWCCPLGGKRRAKILWEHYPELWDKIKENQKRMHESHECFIEKRTYRGLEEEFSEYGQIKLF